MRASVNNKALDYPKMGNTFAKIRTILHEFKQWTTQENIKQSDNRMKWFKLKFSN